MRRYSILLCHLLWSITTMPLTAQEWRQQFQTPFEKSDGWETAEYESAIRFYKSLAEASPRVTITQMGATDSGIPLHLVLVSTGDNLQVADVLDDRRSVLLINNAIHPGESDGVDASMSFARDLAFDNERYGDALNEVIVAIIPLYNIGGALNRNTSTRANQNGPRAYGFRGNGRNYDLNRDFVKCDTRNARSFAEIFQRLDPDLLIDTHVSNGADYQHVMTITHSQKDKLGQQLGAYLHKTFEPKLLQRMKQVGFPTIPYVNAHRQPPDQGFTQFLETPRYSTGYAALFQTIGFMTETHMLKPYPQRVEATRQFMNQAIELLSSEGQTIQSLRRADRQSYHQQDKVAIAWQVDRNQPSRLEFHGYEASYRDSRVTPGQRLFYDRDKPFVKDIPFFNQYAASQSVALPVGYLIPREWQGIIELMKLHGVKQERIQQPGSLSAEIYRIEDVQSRSAPYEGHYFHDTVKLRVTSEKIRVRPGDVVISTDQDRARYVVETLEPAAVDSLFRWNRFDTILQRKEHYSPYVFEETAERMLASDPQLKEAFESRKADDAEFSSDRMAQLDFLYTQSKHNESAYRRYPVARLMELP